MRQSFRAQRGISFLLFSAAALLLASSVFAQVPPPTSGPATGTPAFGSFGGGPDVINLGNLNVHFAIPVLHKPGRGTNFNYDLSYDSSIWTPVTSGSTTTWVPTSSFGWSTNSAISSGNTGYLTYQSGSGYCGWAWDPYGGHPTGGYSWTGNVVYYDPWGVAHHFNGVILQEGGSCGSQNMNTFPSTATDGSGLTVTNYSGPVVTKDGSQINAPVNPTGGTYATTFTDRNGNQITTNTSGNFYDTLSSAAPVLAVAGTAPSNTTFTYNAPSGASTNYTVKYTTYHIQTNFGCTSPSIGEYGQNGNMTANLVTEIDLPDWNQTSNPNSRYTFTYEPTPSHSGFVTGRLASVSLPTGGTISYTYTAGGLTGTAVGSNDPIVCADGTAAGLKRFTPDTGTNYWNYSRSQVNYPTEANHWQTLISDPTTPTANQTQIDFQKDSNTTAPTNNFYETQRQAYTGSTGSTLMQSTATCYNTNTTNCTATTVSSPITQTNVTLSLPSAGSVTLQSERISKYNTVGVPTEFDEYAFGSGAPPSTPTRQTFITYAALNGITSFPYVVKVNAGATVLAETIYNYDETTPVAAPSGTAQLTSASGSRGNLTSVYRCTNLTNCSSYLQTTMTYDTAGQLQTVKDPLNNQTSFSYADTFFTDNGSNPPATYTSSVPTDAYVTKVTLPTTNTLNYGYYYSGQLAKSVDQNLNASYNHYQDLFARPTSSIGPPVPVPGTQTTASPWAFNVYSAAHTQGDAYLAIDDATSTPSPSCTSCRHDKVALDGLGRSIHAYLVSDPEGQTQVDTVYDSLGRTLSGSHPYRSTSDGTYGIETPTYDALGRTIKVTHPDNTYSQTFYGAAVGGTGLGGVTTQNCSSATYGLGFPVLALDEAGKKREVWSDGLGRTIEADEPDSTGALNSKTCYSYDPLGNLLGVAPGGTQNRTYSYDALSRPTTVTTPEGGTTNLYYTTSGGALCAGNPSAVCRRTDARAITTTYFYDTLNRLMKITYSDGTTPTVQYGYDATALTNCGTTPPTLTDSNPKGRMTSMCDGSGATSWAHDAAGRLITEKRTILGVTQTISYSYNLDGSVAAITYPSGKAITYTVSNAQRLTAAKDVTNNIQFATAASYAPPGGLSALITGQISGGFGGVTESHNYNNSLEYTSTKATSTAGTAMDLALNYALSGGDNGTVTSVTNNADTLRTQSFTYDPLNRILSAKSSATSGADCWGQVFGPDGNAADDAVANLTKINNGTQTLPPCTLGSLNATVDANNHINTDSTYAYDASGNMTKDGSGTGWLYAFDAENRLTLATGPTGGPYCYVYDGLGLRVAKKSSAASCSSGTVTKLYWRSLAGDALAETDGSGSTQNEYVFFAGRRIASRDGSGHIFYYFADRLGSTRTITTGSGPGQTPGQLCYDADFTPYGQEISYTTRLQTTACPPSYKFTGYERDSETGLDYAFARHYSSRLGRFLSTDPLGGSIGDLQSHNAYAYVSNNPLNMVDTLGLFGSTSLPPCITNPEEYGCPGGIYPPDPCSLVVLGCGPSPNDPGPGGCPPPLVCAPGGGSGSGGNSSGFTLGIRAPGQSYGQCLNANSSNYSIGGVLGTDNFLLSNDAAGLLFGDRAEGSAGLVVWEGGSHSFKAGVGEVMTAGRRTASIRSLNIAGKTGPATRILAKTGAGKLAGWLTGAAELKLAADLGLTAAEAIGCLVPR